MLPPRIIRTLKWLKMSVCPINIINVVASADGPGNPNSDSLTHSVKRNSRKNTESCFCFFSFSYFCPYLNGRDRVERHFERKKADRDKCATSDKDLDRHSGRTGPKTGGGQVMITERSRVSKQKCTSFQDWSEPYTSRVDFFFPCGARYSPGTRRSGLGGEHFPPALGRGAAPAEEAGEAVRDVRVAAADL